MSHDRPSALSLLAIEKEFLIELKKIIALTSLKKLLKSSPKKVVELI